MTLAAFVQPDGAVTIHPIDTDLDSLQQRLDGGWLEGVTFSETGHAYIDEEGKLKGLPVNALATLVIDDFMPGFAQRDVICGPAIFLGSQPDGEEADVPEDVITVITSVKSAMEQRQVRRSAKME